MIFIMKHFNFNLFYLLFFMWNKNKKKQKEVNLFIFSPISQYILNIFLDVIFSLF